jgi:hypothetical protein
VLDLVTSIVTFYLIGRGYVVVLNLWVPLMEIGVFFIKRGIRPVDGHGSDQI